MELLTIVFLAVGLAMDAFAVSIVTGSIYKELHIRHALRMALFFGGFQSLMPLVGSLVGLGLREHIAAYDHWIAFGLLGLIGGKMIYEAFRIEAAEKKLDPSNLLILLTLSVREQDRNPRRSHPHRHRPENPHPTSLGMMCATACHRPYH